MKPRTGRLTGLAVLTTLALACNLDRAPVGPGGLAFDESMAPPAPLVLHIVAPQATDPAIDQFLDGHYAWLDTTARTNHKLLVFLPGRGQAPVMFQLVQQEAARFGYHVIGLSYVTVLGGLGTVCPIDPDPSTCYENARLEVVDGIDRSPLANVTRANSIDNRLTKLLQFLAAQYPDEGWGRFLLAGAKPKWSQIAISGHSQGGNEAATIAKIRLVARVVLFSSVTDSVHADAPSWESTHITPTDRYWGIAHDRDAFFRAIRAGWDSLGMSVFGPAVAPEESEPPYGFTHMLVTDLVPQRGFVGTNAHGSPVYDLDPLLNADGSCCAPREIWWRYLLTARSTGEDIAERDDE